MSRPKLSFDLNLVDLCKTGFWFCTRCQHVTEPKEDTAGNIGCLFCGVQSTIHWHPPIDTPEEKINPHAIEEICNNFCI